MFELVVVDVEELDPPPPQATQIDAKAMILKALAAPTEVGLIDFSLLEVW